VHVLRRGLVPLRTVVAFGEVLGRERAAVDEVAVGMVAATKLEWIEPELRGKLVEQAFEPERAFDESRRAEGGVWAGVQLRPELGRADVLAGIEHLHRPGGRALEAAEADCHHELPAQGGEDPVRARAGDEPLDRRVPVAAREVLLASRQRAPDGPGRAPRELGREVGVVTRARLGAET